MSERADLVVLLGPTAVGKTELSLRLCEQFGGEVVSADSRQIYRGMDIGTAKATPAEQARVPHHLLDLRTPDQVLTVAEYQQLAYATIDDIHRRRRVPFLVGGARCTCAPWWLGCGFPKCRPIRSCGRSWKTNWHAPGWRRWRNACNRSTRRRQHRSTCATHGVCCGHWRSC